MAYRLRPDLKTGIAIAEMLGQLLQAAANDLDVGSETSAENRDRAVHLARRKLKRARALYRLVAPAIPDLRRRENRRLGDIARSLSPLRDAAALLESVEALQEAALSDEEAHALQQAWTVLSDRHERLAANLEAGQSALMRDAADGCREAADVAMEIAFNDRPVKLARMFAKAWTKTLKRAEAAIAACHDASEAESYHALRKATQTYWMHLSLLRDLWPSAIEMKRGAAKQLADLLGHENDLSVLTSVLDEDSSLFAGGETLSHLLAIIIRQQQALRRQALEAADALFADGPDLEPAVIEALWLRAAAQ
ncbi:CHAD domain-containing protein [Agrobacterium vitis]|uniref:CHAD domain-containing protein n=1 Tax=Agrobacterium vitis TaxID=373 RepID=A0ABD6G5L6_AGRVI|nr:CHAD domain-containing protein [Agrobacterium vitis]MUO78349.1 CHAD domain-containing protein [Agrobacterium vitis]MUO94226.1 CHAD domain-containing protein [Agrobacterium vitis]MUP03319.1 CHAD domain-containing protein [Agrobacterium vitis]MUZ84434.1 CHAD domain-containing protein [Agrobacterium vitis]MVA10342.1 CHAD domain-containing protein [Agrobacterium vitis]